MNALSILSILSKLHRHHEDNRRKLNSGENCCVSLPGSEFESLATLTVSCSGPA